MLVIRAKETQSHLGALLHQLTMNMKQEVKTLIVKCDSDLSFKPCVTKNALYHLRYIACLQKCLSIEDADLYFLQVRLS